MLCYKFTFLLNNIKKPIKIFIFLTQKNIEREEDLQKYL